MPDDWFNTEIQMFYHYQKWQKETKETMKQVTVV